MPNKTSIDLRNDTSYGNKHPQHGLVADGAAGGHPTQGYDGARLDVADHSARDGPGLCNDEELRDVDKRSKATGLDKSLRVSYLEPNSHESGHCRNPKSPRFQGKLKRWGGIKVMFQEDPKIDA